MKQLFLLLMLLCFGRAFSQNSNSDGFIDYQFTHHYDTTTIDKMHSEVMRLYFNADRSVYRSLARLQYDSARHAEFEKAVDLNQTFNMNLGQLPSGSIEQFFTLLKDKKTFSFRRFLKVNYLAVDTASIQWSLHSDTLNILGYLCQKAVGNFKGRIYTVWFANNLPYPIGPWKLKGLPGIILKADDSKAQVSFLATAINSYPSVFDIQLPAQPKYTTYKELMTAIKANRENPTAIQNDGDINIQREGNSVLTKQTKANNPVELID